MSAAPLRIGYGPPGRTEHSASVGRALIAFGLALPVGAVFGVTDTIAVDTARTTSGWLLVAAAALAVGGVLSVLLARAATNLGTAIGSTSALIAVLGAGAWIALFNTGDPAAVDLLVAIGLGASVPALTLGAIDALTLEPSLRPIAAVGRGVVAASAGLAVGAFVMFLDPTLVWSDPTTVGGAIALLGALRRLTLADRVRGAGPRPAPPAEGGGPVGLRVLLAACVGVTAAGVVRIAPYLAENWQAGVRYHLLTIVAAGATGAALVVGLLWLPPRLERRGSALVDDAARLTVLAGATMLLVAISQTLIGTVAGTGLAAGVAIATIVMLAAGGATGDGAPAAAVAAATLVGLAAWIATWAGWSTLIDATGSQRATLALISIPALILGGMVWVRPVATQLDAPDRAEIIDLSNGLERPPAAAPIPDGRPTLANLNGTATLNGTASGTGTSDGTRPPRPVLLEARSIEFSYGAVQVLFGVDLQVRQGEVVALLGTNGAGKTTFLRTVAGLATPSSGSIRLAGGDLARFSAADRVLLGINQIAAGAAVAPDLTVAENLAMFGHTLKPSKSRAGTARAIEVFPRLGERLGQRAAALSGGERQMLALCKSLVLRPRLLIIDECTLGLAPIAVASLVPVIRQLHAEGSAVLLVEQSVHLALDLADRACCMEKGRIVYESDAEELRADAGLLESVYLEGISAALEHRVLAGDDREHDR